MPSRSLALAFLVASSGLPETRAAAQASGAASPTPDPFAALFATPPTERTLPNGLRLVRVHWPSPGIVAYYTVVRVGSRDELEPGRTGFAHFFEHMMFRGTARTSGDAYAEALQRVGADNNAYTSSDLTCYTIVGPTSALGTFIDLEADRFRNLAYTESAFRTEAGAVRGEYQVWSSNPLQPMWEGLVQTAFTRHPYGHTTLGLLADIDAMPEGYTYAQQFFRRYYTPDNTTVIVVGDFDDAALDAAIDAHYGGWSGRRHQPRVPSEPAQTSARTVDLSWAAPTPPRMLIGYRTPAFVTRGTSRDASLRESAALQLIARAVFGPASPLYDDLVVQRRLALELDADPDPSRDPGLFTISVTLAEGAAFDVVGAAIQGALDDFSRGTFDPRRLEAARNHLLYDLPMRLETPASVANFLARHIALSPDLRVARDSYLALATIPASEVASVSARVLTSAGRTTVTLHTEETPR